jgi:signal recognition particle receptor subunit beta
LLPIIKKAAPHSRVAILANKQDLPSARAPIEISQTFGLKTYPIVAIRDEYRNPIKKIVAQLIELNIKDWDPILDRYITHPGISLKI